MTSTELLREGWHWPPSGARPFSARQAELMDDCKERTMILIPCGIALALAIVVGVGLYLWSRGKL